MIDSSQPARNTPANGMRLAATRAIMEGVIFNLVQTHKERICSTPYKCAKYDRQVKAKERMNKPKKGL